MSFYNSYPRAAAPRRYAATPSGPRAMASKFAGRCVVCRASFPPGAAIVWERGVGSRHADATVCATFAAAPAPAPVVVDMKPIADFLTAAKDRGLKFPKARFLAPGNREMRLSVAGDKSRTPGAIQVVIAGEWVGRIAADGTVGGRLATETDLLATLTTIAANPAAAAKAYGALTCRCSFCDKALTDEGSVEVGYGPICAKQWGLPHTARGSKVLGAVAPVAAPVAAPTPAPAPAAPTVLAGDLGWEELLGLTA